MALTPRALLICLLPVLFGTLYGPTLHRWLTVNGLLRRQLITTRLATSADLFWIPDTKFCEDIHYYAPGNVLFTACEDVADTRFVWFPPLAIFKDPQAGLKAKGSIHVINPETMSSDRLVLQGFDGPFVTHGIDVIKDPALKNGVFIFAVNHVPSTAYLAAVARGDTAKSTLVEADSRIEIFHHILGSSKARHVRSVSHPLIRTPNDILALSPTSFYVTNDHFYRSGSMRLVEDMYHGGRWTDTIHVQLPSDSSSMDVQATVALTGLHNNNGLGHGRTPQEVLIGSAASGRLHLGTISTDVGANSTIHITESIGMDSMIDNPSYFSDPYGDKSGFVLAGLGQGWKLGNTMTDPSGRDAVMVCLVTPSKRPGGTAWEKKLLFQDPGTKLRTASAAVLVPNDPATEEGERTAWLFVTGFLSTSAIAVRVKL